HTPTRSPTSNGVCRKARPDAKQTAASSATSPAASTGYSNTEHRPRLDKHRSITGQPRTEALRSPFTVTFRGVKKRLDVALVERGLAETRSQAHALVLAGLVPGFDKPGTQVDDDADLHVERPPR